MKEDSFCNLFNLASNDNIANKTISNSTVLQNIYQLYQLRNQLNRILYKQYPEFKELCRIVMINQGVLIIHANGSKASHLVTLKQDQIMAYMKNYASFKAIAVKNVVSIS